ncbi:hypothetical protein Q1695_000286 [Nippostrongylus brasiliensis]|nr:hypothetical protein Q1695_000286 [Nippostrongylus brasiliensis]
MIATFFVILSVSLLGSTQRSDLLSRAVGPCIGGRCQPAHTCYFDQCVPQALLRRKRSFDRSTAIGPCIDNRCPRGYFCHLSECLSQI